MRLKRFETPSWTDAVDLTIGSTTWYVGQDMKEWTRKHHGYQPGTLPTHQNFTSYSTSDTPISWAHKTASRSHDSCWISTHRTYHKFFLLFLSFSKAFSFFSLCLPLLMILKMSLFLYFSSLCFSPLYCS